jgi:hypothetical protein
VVALLTLALVVRLSMAPIGLGVLKPWVEQAVAAQTPGGRAHLDRVALAWFAGDSTLGLELDNVRLTDAAGRPVLLARRMNFGFAVDALPGLVLAPGRLTASQFFVAISVSPQGRYALGYDAKGAPPPAAGGPVDPGRLLLDLTGKPKLGRALSYLRTLDLTDGRVALRQVAGPVAWTADVRSLRFGKTRTRLTSRVDVGLEGADHPATLRADAAAAVGLGDALVTGHIDNLVPAKVFPSVGAAADLAGLDAVVRGRGSLSYALSQGVRAADLTVLADRGILHFGGADQAFQSAQVRVVYAPQTGEVLLQALKVEAERTRLDLTGRFRLTPRDPRTRRPARLDYSFGGPRFVWRLAADAPPQDLFDVAVHGRLIPELKRLEIDDARATVVGVPLQASGVLFRDKQNQLGVQLRARAFGAVGKDQIFAFWPEDFAKSVRDYLRRAVLGGRFDNAVFQMDAHPGHMHADGLENEELRLDFGFVDAGFRFADSFPPIEQGRGSARLQGNRLDLQVADGHIADVALSEGVVTMPSFHNHGEAAIYKFRAQGPVRSMLQALDGPHLNLISHGGFSPARASGVGDVYVEIHRPMLFEVPAKDLRIRYKGQIKGGGVTQAALGWDLTGAAMTLEGDESHFTLKGTGEAGPYRGGLDFLSTFKSGAGGGQLLDLNGALDAAILGGPADRTTPFGGRFVLHGGGGSGQVRAAIFDGHVAWTDGDGPRGFTLDGWSAGAALRKAGAPFTQGLPDRFPTHLVFARRGQQWRGPLTADALSGLLTFTAGAKPRLIYDTELTPARAKRLGLGQLPLFSTPRRLLVDASWVGADGTAEVKTGPLDVQLGWTVGPGGAVDHRARAVLTAADAAALGLPPLIPPGPGVAVIGSWKAQGAGFAGVVQLPDTQLHFQAAPARGGGETLTLAADLDRNALRRVGLPQDLRFDGLVGLVARLTLVEHGPLTGRVDLDLTRADLALNNTDWRKPAGRPAHAGFDLAEDAANNQHLTHIQALADNIDIEGSALFAAGKLVMADLPRNRLAGFLDAALRVERDASTGALTLTVKGRQLDARRWLSRTPEPASAVTSVGSAEAARNTEAPPLKLDAALDQVRLTEDTTLHDVHAVGVWGGVAVTRLDITAATSNGGKVHGRLFPQGAFTAVQADTTDAGEIARGLFQVKDLKGGRATITGHLVENGADLDVHITDVRVVHAPVLAQLLTVGSFKGLADTLNGDGVLFTKVEAPVQIRGSRLILGESRATGSALGLTAEGTADISSGRMDVRGNIAPAYSLNSAMGAVPVLGQLLTSRKGEGVFGLSYTARGALDKPQVSVNPLSIVTPGILRRIFEGGGSASAPPPTPAPSGAPRPGGE